MKANVENYDEYGAADYEFHLSIAKASKNMIFYSVLVRCKEYCMHISLR